MEPDRGPVIHVILCLHHHGVPGLPPTCSKVPQHVTHHHLRIGLGDRAQGPRCPKGWGRQGTVQSLEVPRPPYLDVRHVGLYHGQPIARDELTHQLDSLLIGRHLCPQVRQVVVQVAGPTAARDTAGSQQGLGHGCRQERERA